MPLNESRTALHLQMYERFREIQILKRNYSHVTMVVKLQIIVNRLVMNGIDVKEMRDKFGMSQESFAKIIGVASRTIQNWESGGTIPQTKQAILREISLNPQIYFGGEQQNINGTNQQTTTNNHTTNNYGECEDSAVIVKLIDELAEQRKMSAKSQEQIDRLLAIIEKMG